jgi:hypothetical protein
LVRELDNLAAHHVAQREARLEATWRALRRQRLGAITHEQCTLANHQGKKFNSP